MDIKGGRRRTMKVRTWNTRSIRFHEGPNFVVHYNIQGSKHSLQERVTSGKRGVGEGNI